MDDSALFNQIQLDISSYIQRILDAINDKSKLSVNRETLNFGNIYNINYYIENVNLSSYIKLNGLEKSLIDNVSTVISNILKNNPKFKLLNIKIKYSLKDTMLIIEIIVKENIQIQENLDNKIYQYLSKVNIDSDSKRMYTSCVDNFTRIAWTASKTFKDLQTLTLMFIQNYLKSTPYHMGPLDEESYLISNKLYDITRFDFITTNSQPYEEFQSLIPSDKGKTVIQTPFIEGIIPRRKSDVFIQELFKKNPNIMLQKYQYNDGNLLEYNVDREYIKRKENDKMPSVIYHTIYPPEIEVYSRSPPYYFGRQTQELLNDECDFIYITTEQQSNEIFDDIISVLKSLLYKNINI